MKIDCKSVFKVFCTNNITQHIIDDVDKLEVSKTALKFR